MHTNLVALHQTVKLTVEDKQKITHIDKKYEEELKLFKG